MAAAACAQCTTFSLPPGPHHCPAPSLNPSPRSKTPASLQVLRAPNSQYHNFNDTEKVQLLENLVCPEQPYANGGECFGWFHWGMSLVLKFDLLRPRILAAVRALRRR